MTAPAMALLPLVSLLALLLIDRCRKMRQLRNESQGLPVEQALMELMLAIQQHRGLAGAWLNGDASFRGKMLAVQERIDRHLAAIRERHAVLTANEATDAAWKRIADAWRELSAASRELGVAESFARHSALIGQVLELKSRFADACEMTLDPHPASYSLLDALIAKLPATLEHVAQARGMGTAIAARGSMAFAERMRMVALSTLIRHSLAGLRQALAAAGARDGKLGEIDDFLRLLDDSLIESAEIRLQPERCFAQGTQAIDAGQQLYGDIGAALAERLRRRADGYRLQVRLAGFGVTAAALSIVYLHQLA